jgi:hypothetical protein
MTNQIVNKISFQCYRLNDGNDNGKDFEFSSNFIKNFDNEGHKLTIDGSYTKIKIMKIQPLMVSILPDKSYFGTTLNSEIQEQFQFQTDYVLPTGEGSQFEAGYKGNFNNLKIMLFSLVIMEIIQTIFYLTH